MFTHIHYMSFQTGGGVHLNEPHLLLTAAFLKIVAGCGRDVVHERHGSGGYNQSL
jgi:hypothetical protein